MIRRTALPPRRQWLKRYKIPARVSAKKRREYQRTIDVRAAIRVRSGGRCEVRFSKHCARAATQFHHVVKASQGGEFTEENILHSCWWCNHEIELEPIAAIAAGVSRRRNPRPGDPVHWGSE